MRWETVKSTAEQEVYHLYKEDKKRLTLVLNPFSNSARIECDKEKRVFLLRKEGFRRNKTVIRNEYGIKIAEFGQENGQPFIIVNDKKFFYIIQNNPLAELVLFKEIKEQPLVSCNITTPDGSGPINFTKDKKLGEMPHPGLLMALCWYMFLPVAKENTVEPVAIG